VAQDLATRLAALPPSSIQATKAFIRQGDDEKISQVMHAEAEKFWELMASPEAIEAMTAFMERRVPDFSQF
jgi:enoyl-CoA hydratase/carnithine racemase